jgi:Uma2 family endonuclease
LLPQKGAAMIEAAIAIPPARRADSPWSWDELAELPEDGQRHEIIEGRLLVSPAPGVDHQQLARRIANLLEATWPDLDVVEAVNVRLGTSTLVPDVVAARRQPYGAVWIDAADVLLAVEVVSPSSPVLDRGAKPAQYAAAGIPAYWRVEPAGAGALSVVVHRLDGDSYRETDAVRAGETAQLGEPRPLRLAPAEFTGPHQD